MVDGQVRPNKVSDSRIISAMRRLPRERFLPPHLAALAYADEDVKLPGGRALMEPMVIARLLQISVPRAGENALVVGAGAGYGAAILASCGVNVTALEEDPALLGLARQILPELAPAVRLAEGRLAEGWKPAAPYDLVLIEGAVAFVPDAIMAQIKFTHGAPGRATGRIVTVVNQGGRIGHGAVGEPVAADADNTAGNRMSIRFQTVFDCATPMLPALRRPPGFVF
jgi:protein-L-isoaspartate(D-aspartate) O-methyltransferase